MHNFKINWLNLIPLSLAMLPRRHALRKPWRRNSGC